jgi:hypothetical protein
MLAKRMGMERKAATADWFLWFPQKRGAHCCFNLYNN